MEMPLYYILNPPRRVLVQLGAVSRSIFYNVVVISFESLTALEKNAPKMITATSTLQSTPSS